MRTRIRRAIHRSGAVSGGAGNPVIHKGAEIDSSPTVHRDR